MCNQSSKVQPIHRGQIKSNYQSLSFSLIDYEDDSVPTTTNGATATADGATAGSAGTGAVDVKKGSYVGIHSTGFRDFLLKPELLRAISDLGFEHPSEG